MSFIPPAAELQESQHLPVGYELTGVCVRLRSRTTIPRWSASFRVLLGACRRGSLFLKET